VPTLLQSALLIQPLKWLTPKNEDAFDRVFIVIDRDTHPTYEHALKKLKQFDRAAIEKFTSIVSFPSFEVWILYHFIYTRSPMPSADDVIKKIKACGFNYDKANNNLFDNTVENLNIAFGNAQRSIKEARVDSEFNPSTEFSILISELTSIANPNAIDTLQIKDIEAIIKSAVNDAFELSLSQVVLDDELFSALHPHLTSTSIYHDAVERFKNTSGLEVSVVDGVFTVKW
jgi:hypothetical protein